MVFLIVVGLILLLQNRAVFRQEKKAFTKGDMQNVVAVTITNNNQKTKLSVRNNVWYLKDRASKEEKIDAKKNNTFITSILGLNKNEIVSTNPKKYEEFGVTGNKMIEFELKNNMVHIPGKKPKKLVLYIGGYDVASLVYFRVNTDPNVYLTPIDLVKVLSFP